MSNRRADRSRPRRGAAPAPSGGPQTAATLLCSALIVFAGVVAYHRSFSGVFVLDDRPAIVRNPNIRSLWPLSRAMSAPPEVTVAGRPIVSLTLALNYALAPADARDGFEVPPPGSPVDAVQHAAENRWGYHALNLAIHLLAGLTLFGVARRTIDAMSAMSAMSKIREDPSGSRSSRATPLALAVALIWLVHPLQTASVTYIVQRAESLMGLFYLLTLYCAIRAREPRGRRWWITGSIVACGLGMGSKEVMVTAPLLVVLWDAVFGARGAVSLGQHRVRLYAGLASTWVIPAWLMATQPRTHSVGFAFGDWPWWRYLLTQTEVVIHYLRLAFVPQPLVLDYGWPAVRSVGQVLPQFGLLVGLVALTGWLVWRRRPEGFAAAWFFIVLAPTSSVVPVVTEVAAEHRMYLPLAAVVGIVVVGGHALLCRVPERAARWIALTLVAVTVVGFARLTDVRNRDYESDEGIWLDTVQKRPLNARARNNYAADLIAHGDNAAAEVQLRAAIALDGRLADARANLGVALCRLDRCDEGIVQLQQALTIDSGATQAHRDLGEAYGSQGRSGLAAAEFLTALGDEPDDVFLLNRAAWILATAPEDGVRNGAQAVVLAQRAVSLSGRGDEVSLDSLAVAMAETGRFEEAAAAGAEAIAVARKKGDQMILPELEARLGVYRSGQRYRQPIARWR